MPQSPELIKGKNDRKKRTLASFFCSLEDSVGLRDRVTRQVDY